MSAISTSSLRCCFVAYLHIESTGSSPQAKLERGQSPVPSAIVVAASTTPPFPVFDRLLELLFFLGAPLLHIASGSPPASIAASHHRLPSSFLYSSISSSIDCFSSFDPCLLLCCSIRTSSNPSDRTLSATSSPPHDTRRTRKMASAIKSALPSRLKPGDHNDGEEQPERHHGKSRSHMVSDIFFVLSYGHPCLACCPTGPLYFTTPSYWTSPFTLMESHNCPIRWLQDGHSPV